MIFNALRSFLSNLQFYFSGVEIEIARAYAYMGVHFMGPRLACDNLSSLESTKGTTP